MKKFKKIFAAIAASALVAAMSFTSMAAASITIDSGLKAGEGTETTKYTYYQMLKASVSGDNVAYYVENEDLKTAIEGLKSDLNDDGKAEEALFTVSGKTVAGNRWNVIPSDDLKKLISTNRDEAAKKLATAFKTIKDKAIIKNDFDRGANGTGPATATNLTEGYYLIESSLGTVLAINTVGNDNIEIHEKNDYPTLTKTGSTDTASYGEEITYTVVVGIPASVDQEPITIIDTMTKGLTPVTKTVESKNVLDVKAVVKGTENVVNVTASEATTDADGKQAITITIPANVVKSNAGKDIELTYKATLNKDAVKNDAEKNTAVLHYADYISTEKFAEVTTYGFTLTKMAENTAKEAVDIDATAGDAQFSLWKSESSVKAEDQIGIVVKDENTNTYRVATAGETSVSIYAGGSTGHKVATIEGLAAGTYYLQEDEAPKGYNKLESRVKITVTADDKSAKDFLVLNKVGIQLPSTGGMGTVAFAVVGLIVMAGAAVTLIIKKRA